MLQEFVGMRDRFARFWNVDAEQRTIQTIRVLASI